VTVQEVERPHATSAVVAFGFDRNAQAIGALLPDTFVIGGEFGGLDVVRGDWNGGLLRLMTTIRPARHPFQACVIRVCAPMREDEIHARLLLESQRRPCVHFMEFDDPHHPAIHPSGRFAKALRGRPM
jgi:hypothetical protein